MHSSAQPVAFVASRLASTWPLPFCGRPTPRSTTMATCVWLSACESERGSSGGSSGGSAAVLEGATRRSVAAAAIATAARRRGIGNRQVGRSFTVVVSTAIGDEFIFSLKKSNSLRSR